MSRLKDIVRRGFAGGGIATLLLAGLFVLGGPAPSTLLVAGWLAIVGLSLFLAGIRERVPVAGRLVGWPRVGAAGIAAFAIGAVGFGLSQLYTLEVASGTWLLAVAITVFVPGYLAWFALECWAGGRRLNDEMFAVE
ncbi:hypothetical protein [Natrinema longum]|uniref:Uncharacterized protein n=1 Tax=Natrinema longum TaxID=370324 RepID=A0A8A2U6S5_9EURY|nr:hypothetical protein [Natrinema longum]MBZ6494275.1 hypothetical protein [Natrinema longum]QSW84400.1 hypothetical protein J0X27_13195 [Natrinema longum]